MHEERSRTRVKDPVAHVRNAETTRHVRNSLSVHHVQIGCYTEEEDEAAMLQNTSPSFCLTKKKTADLFTVRSFH